MHWAKVSEAGNARGIKILLWVARVCGRWPFRVALFFVLLWYYPVRTIPRRSSREYLTRLYDFSGGTTPRPTGWNVFRHFFAFAENVLDKLLAAQATKEKPAYQGGGGEQVKKLVAEGRGAMFVTAHYGNLELCRELFQARSRVPITFFGYIEHAAGYNKMLSEMGHSIQMLDAARVGPDTALILAERLEQGGFIVIAGDRRPLTGDARTITIDFLGRPAAIPVSPYWLAAALGCPLFSAFGRRDGNRFHMAVHLIAEKLVLPRNKHERVLAIEPYARAYVKNLEQQCLEAPLQWMNFFPFWYTPDQKSTSHESANNTHRNRSNRHPVS